MGELSHISSEFDNVSNIKKFFFLALLSFYYVHVNLVITSKEETLFGTARKVPCLCSFGYYHGITFASRLQPQTFHHSSCFSILFSRLFKLYWKTTHLRRCKMMVKVPMMPTTN
jgi:hypothetical protein